MLGLSQYHFQPIDLGLAKTALLYMLKCFSRELFLCVPPEILVIIDPDLVTY
jgi:hypothetical protein